jgi:hypothetical protein
LTITETLPEPQPHLMKGRLVLAAVIVVAVIAAIMFTVVLRNHTHSTQGAAHSTPVAVTSPSSQQAGPTPNGPPDGQTPPNGDICRVARPC